MKKVFNYIKSLSPYLFGVWLVVILVLSSIPKVPEIKFDTGKLEIKIDYILHFTEYLALAALALLSFARNENSLRSLRVLSVLICLMLFAALDESHQLLIPGRSFNISDMLSNFIGIISGILLTLRLNRIYSPEG